MPRVRGSWVWSHFTKTDEDFVKCNICNNSYSHKGRATNLRKHLIKFHNLINSDETDMSNSDGNSDQEQTPQTKIKNDSLWSYFDISETDKSIVTCKVCEKELSRDREVDLTKHLNDHGLKLEDNENILEYTEKTQPGRSIVWQYFNKINYYLAICILCKRTLSYRSSISNLRKHLNRKHPEIFSKKNKETKRIIITANGQLYEVDTSNQDEDDAPNEKNPIEDTVFVDSQEVLEDQDDERSPKHFAAKRNSSPKKFNKFPPKRKMSKSKFKKACDLSSSNDSSSEEEIKSKRMKVKKNMDRLDIFAQYVVTLLRELPKTASDELQCDIINKILTKKVSLENQEIQKAKFSFSVSQSGNIDITPVTVNENINSEVAQTVLVETTDNLKEN